MDYYKYAVPIVLPGSGVTYFSANTNKGLFVCSGLKQGDYHVDVLHVTGTNGATAWFRYAMTNNTLPFKGIGEILFLHNVTLGPASTAGDLRILRTIVSATLSQLPVDNKTNFICDLVVSFGVIV